MTNLALILEILLLAVGLMGVFTFDNLQGKTVAGLLLIGGSIILSGISISSAIRENDKN